MFYAAIARKVLQIFWLLTDYAIMHLTIGSNSKTVILQLKFCHAETNLNDKRLLPAKLSTRKFFVKRLPIIFYMIAKPIFDLKDREGA